MCVIYTICGALCPATVNCYRLPPPFPVWLSEHTNGCSNGFLWQTVPQKLVYAVLFNRASLCQPLGTLHHSLAQEWGSSWGLGNAERWSSGWTLVGEAHLVLSLSHHLMLRVPHHSSHLAMGFGEALRWLTVCCITTIHHPQHATWGHDRLSVLYLSQPQLTPFGQAEHLLPSAGHT